MTWRRYLQVKTRDPAFLWRMVLGILAAGVAIGLVVDWAVPAWVHPDAAAKLEDAPRDERWSQLEVLADHHQWLAVWQRVPAVVASTWARSPALTALAVLTGVCWLAFVLQAGQIRSWKDHRLWAPLVGVALGVASVWPTVFFIMWQEHGLGLTQSKLLTAGLRYFIVGVGLREELSKFACFALLLPWLVRRRDELAAFVAAACVGIGFGMEENVNYITGSEGTAALSRLLMPVPLHMAWTGLLGLAAYRACRWPRQWAPQFVATFGVVVLIHGLYDAIFELPALRDFAVASFIMFVLVQYQFFHELRPLLGHRPQPVSLTANFLFCVSMTAAATFVYLSAAIGWREAGDVLISGVVADSAMVYLFLREMPESLVGV